jgi:hypothetical protein
MTNDEEDATKNRRKGFNLKPLTFNLTEEDKMKTKWILGIVAVVTIWSIFSISQGADKFYYGGYHVLVHGPEHIPWQRDSLKFNIGSSFHIDQSNIEWFVDNSMRAIPDNPESPSPAYWSRATHYTLWEAEGLLGSWVNLQYNDGTLVNDASASGGKAMKFIGPGTPGLIQWGPNYEQERGPEEEPIEYTAEFRLRFIYSLYQPRGAMGPGPPPNPKVCSLMVVDTVRDSILRAKTIYKSDFPGGEIGPYQTFTFEDYTVPDDNRIEFQIHWFGIAGNLYIDYVKVYDENGKWLMSGEEDQNIIDYVSQSWVNTTIPETGDTVVYRWYLKDEPKHIDVFEPGRYIDSLLRTVSQERIVNQTLNRIWKPEKVFCNKRK